MLNKITERRFDVNRRALQQKFPNIRGVLETDCEDGTGIEALRHQIADKTDRLEHLRDDFPASWFSIKDDLASMDDNYLTYAEYQRICTAHQETDPAAQKDLAGYLHSLGIVLNYAEDPRLRDTHVLNPRWVTEGIYTILNYPPLAASHGEIHLRNLGEMLNPAAYPDARHPFLFDLMRKFELCFPFPDEDGHYLIPELLDKQQPEAADAFDLKECLNFQYHYPALPEGLLPRFIVRTHVLNRDLPRWKTGVILAFEGNRALVKADPQDKRVSIAITGPTESRQRLLAVIRSDFEHIHGSFTFTPAVQEMVPVPEHPEVLVPYQELRAFAADNRDTYPILIGNHVTDLLVQTLLNGVDLQGTMPDLPPSERGFRRPIVHIFISYAHKDESWRNELETYLKILQRQYFMITWSDRKIIPGEEWAEQIDTNLEQANMILLLVSADFLASDYCYDIEMKRALARHKAGEARMIPIIVRDCPWASTPLFQLQALPPDGKSVDLWENKDSAWKAVAVGIEQVAAELIAVQRFEQRRVATAKQ